MLKVLKHMVLFIVCFLFSIFVCMNFFDEILIRFTLSNVAYMAMRIVIAFILYNLIISFFNKKIKNYQINILVILYVFLILSLSFFKGSYNKGVTSVNINPLNIINDFKNADNTILLLIGNFSMYIPIGIYLRYKIKSAKKGYLALIFIVYSFFIEGCQYVFKVGVFDINDIILNSLGFTIGLFILNLLSKIPIFKRKKC